MVAKTMAAKKAKGRRLQQWVADKVLSVYVQLGPRDVKSTSMGANGADVELSEAAFKVFPYAVECKNLADHSFMRIYEQAEDHTKVSGGSPLVVLKTDNHKPIVAMDAEDFFVLLQRRNNHV